MSKITPTANMFVDPQARQSFTERVHGAIQTATKRSNGGDGAKTGKELTTKRLVRFGAVILALMLVSLGVSYTTSETQSNDLRRVHDAGKAVQSSEQSMTDGQEMIVAFYGVLNALRAGDATALRTSRQGGRDSMASFDEHMAEVAAFLGARGGNEHLDAALAVYEGLEVMLTEFFDAPSISALTSNATVQGAAALVALRAEQEAISAHIEAIGDAETTDAVDAARRGVLMVLFASLLAIAAFGWVGRNVFKSVGNMRHLQLETDRLSGEAAVAQDRERLVAGELQAKVDSMLVSLAGAAAGDLTVEVSVSGDDAVGRMGQALSKLLTDLRFSVASIATNSEALASASEELQVVAGQMGANSSETSNQVNLVSGASVQVSDSIETASAGAVEMTASIKQIARNASDAAKVANQAVEAARLTNTTVTQLGESSAEIGEIVKVITGIAQQTNLLALNATIEAARAGEAGKGFAVVANEVKELAKETAKATEDISAKIAAIQSDTQRSVESIAGILEIINQIAEFQDTIASAVEQQAATTNEISRSVTDASLGSSEITANIQAVAAAADSTAAGAGDSQRAATELARMATDLQTLVAQFTY
jgi:methyl-accepting chemotaxis protein